MTLSSFVESANVPTFGRFSIAPVRPIGKGPARPAPVDPRSEGRYSAAVMNTREVEKPRPDHGASKRETSVPRNLVICCDGTNNKFGAANTSVVRLVQALDRNPERQRLYYDPGVGTLPEPGTFTRFGKGLSEVWGLAFGTGLTTNVEEAYACLMDLWEPGDRVFLFGFSRGAYTVRVLAGMLHALGLLPRGNQNLVPYVMRLFSAVRRAGRPTEAGGDSSYWKLCDDFRRTFSRPMHDGDEARRFRTHFLGVWDTVSSVGWVWDPTKFPFTAKNPSIDVVRHAVAIDERRAFFRQNLMNPADGQDFREVWFPGVHGDVGGGYPEKDGGLWRPSFEWMTAEAEKAGLLIDAGRARDVMTRTMLASKPWNDEQHESLTPLWWPAEFFPKLSWRKELSRRVPRINLGKPRRIENGAGLHWSALRRIRESSYAPPNLSTAFLDSVRRLKDEDVPETLAYTP